MIPVAAILIALATAAPHVPAEARARYAADIAAATDDLEVGLALVATATVESDWRGTVASCTVVGDHGAALGLYQLHAQWYGGHTAEEVCASNRLSSRLAARAIAQLRRVTGSYETALYRYVGCKRLDDPRVAKRLELFRKLKEGAKS